MNCQRQGDTCDYSIRLNWEGRTKRKPAHATLRTGLLAGSIAASIVGKEERHNTTGQFESVRISSTSEHSNQTPPPWALGSDSMSSYPAPRTLPTERTRSFSSISSGGQQQVPGPAIYPRTFPGNDPSHLPQDSARGARDEITRLPPSVRTIQPGSTSPYPSPSDSSIASPGIIPLSFQQASQTATPASYTPRPQFQNPFSPLPVYTQRPLVTVGEYDHHSKRIETASQHPQHEAPDMLQPMHCAEVTTRTADSHQLNPPPGTTLLSPTTDSSDTTSDEACQASQQQAQRSHGHSTIPQTQAQTRLHRVSVQSLLSHSAVDVSLVDPETAYTASLDGFVFYGFDSGRPDLDTNRNDDSQAIEYHVAAIEPPPTSPWSPMTTSSATDSEHDNTRKRVTAVFTKGGYYARPVAINIPRHLRPLPSTLLESQINLLYFYHFLNHTSKILVPHDCANNPFSNVLPASECLYVGLGMLY